MNASRKVELVRRDGQKGSTLIFFAVVLLPIVFVLFTLGLDLSLYFTASEKLQKGVDEAVMYAYRFLPNAPDTEAAAINYLNTYSKRFELPVREIKVNVESDTVSVLLEALAPLNFGKWFGFDAGLPIQTYASAKSSPLDIFIALDCAGYLAPDPVNGTPWGTESDWPAATFFSEEFPFYISDPAENSRQVKVSDRLMTQQCFNPVFSRAKLAAISLYEFFSMYQLNSIGVGFFPGQLFEIDVARNVVKGGLRTGIPGEADFDDRSGSLLSSNLMCAAAAARERVNNGYKFTRVPAVPPVEFDSALSFNPEYSAEARTSEVIWSRAANVNAEADISAVIRGLRSSLFSAQSRIERGGLTGRAKKVAVVLMGDLPREGAVRYPDVAVDTALRDELGELVRETAEFELDSTFYFVVYKREGIVNENEFESGLSALKELLQGFEFKGEKSRLKLKLLGGIGPQELVSEVASTLVLDQRSIVLSR